MDYTSQVDIWGLGCVMAELLLVVQEVNSREVGCKEPMKLEDIVMFPGTSCFPLTACHESKSSNEEANLVSNNDQLIKILESLGPQDD